MAWKGAGAVKDVVLSRGESPTLWWSEGWHRGSPLGRTGVDVRLFLQPGKFGRLRPGSGHRVKGTEPVKGKGPSQTPPCHTALPAQRGSS